MTNYIQCFCVDVIICPCCTLKTKDPQFDNIVITGGTVSCHNDNLQCHQWGQSCQIDDLMFSVIISVLAYLISVSTRGHHQEVASDILLSFIHWISTDGHSTGINGRLESGQGEPLVNLSSFSLAFVSNHVW